MSAVTDRLKSLLTAATPGPWKVHDEIDHHGDRNILRIVANEHTVDHGLGPERDWTRIVETDSGYYEPGAADADLIVSAINALPQLLACVEAAEAWRGAVVASVTAPCSCGDESIVHEPQCESSITLALVERYHAKLADAVDALKERP